MKPYLKTYISTPARCLFFAALFCLTVFALCSGTPSGDAILLAEVIGALDFNSVMKAIDSLDRSMKESAEKAAGQLKTLGKVSEDTAAELKAMGQRQLELGQRLSELEQKGLLPLDGDSKHDESVGLQVTKSSNYGDFVSALKAGKVGRGQAVSVEVKNTVTNAIANTYADRRPGVLAGAERTLRIEDLLSSVPTSAPSIQYVRENVFTNAAAEVAEGAPAPKPESSITFTPVTLPVETVAHWIRITEQLASDNAAMVAYINNRMVYGVNLRVENQLIAGNGTTPNLSGLFNLGNFTAHGYTAASLTAAGLANNRFDLIGKIIGDSEATDWPADVILLNPVDWWTMRLTKDTQGRYLLGDPGVAGDRVLFGRPVVTSAAIAASNVGVANLGQAATLYVREGMRVQMSTEDQDNFVRNLITLRAERRCALAIERPAAIRYGALVPA